MLNPKRDTLMLLVVIVTFEYFLVSSDEFFESVNARLICYKRTQEGCSKDLIEALPEYAWSHDNLTKATTHFYLFTKNNIDEPELLHKCAADVPPNTNFNPKCRTEIFIPGFVSGVCNFAIYRELKNERLKYGCYNVILVDWMWGNIFDLKESKLNLKILAKQIVFLIRNLKKRYGLGADHFILTGHSYGAHCAGFVGQDEPIGIINGLDPAGVLFTENTPLDDRLDAGDATNCVQVTHCNAGQCLPGYFGVNFTCGTIDVYYNDGLFQPSCYPQILESILKGDLIYAFFSLLPAACSHFQCLQYYKASMYPTNDCQPLGVRCPNKDVFENGRCKSCGFRGRRCVEAGAYACDCRSASQVGKSYYLKTKLFCPFCDNSTVQKGRYYCQAASHQTRNY